MYLTPVQRRRIAFAAFGILGLVVSSLSGGCTRASAVSVPMRYRPTSSINLAQFSGSVPRTKIYVAPVFTDATPKMVEALLANSAFRQALR